MIRTIQEAEAALQPYIPLVAQLTGKDTTLERVVPLMALAGNPQDKLRVVHIAGTSGKTSTSYYVAALLRATGSTVGLTVSPHIDSVTERVQINGSPLSKGKFCRELEAFLEVVRQAEQPPSYFDLMYCFALWTFARRGVDYAVIETGMGGLYDATNVAARPDKVCVITDIGYDHTHILGVTLPEITRHKIGIAHKGNEVFMYKQSAEVMAVARRWVREQGAQLRETSEADERAACPVAITELPLYQQRNWLLAHCAYTYIQGRDNLPNLTNQALHKTLATVIPGRMEIRQIGGKTLVMDGAHNQQKMTTFVASFQERFPGVKPAVLAALKEGKEHDKVIPLLAPFAARIYLTAIETSPELPVRSIAPDLLAAELQANFTGPIEPITDQHQAFQALLSAPEPIVVITGSFYLLSQLRKNERIIS